MTEELQGMQNDHRRTLEDQSSGGSGECIVHSPRTNAHWRRFLLRVRNHNLSLLQD